MESDYLCKRLTVVRHGFIVLYGFDESAGMFDQFRNDAVYNTRAVVQRTGVPADTIRAWERRYGVPSPQRTPGNQRLYSDRDIAVVSWLRDQTREGLTISQAVNLLKSENQRLSSVAFLHSISSHSGGDFDHPDAYSRYSSALVDALSRFDGLSADKVVEEAIAMLPVEEVCLQVMAPALRQIGDLWHQGQLGIASEHFASGFVHRKLSALFNASQPERGRGPVLAACVEGEQHEIGLLLTSVFLARGGYHVVYLGANVPVSDLVQATNNVRPRAVLLSASTVERIAELNDTVSHLRREFNSTTVGGRLMFIGYGGRVFVDSPELRDSIEADFLGASARETLASVDQMMDGS
ncbi:cobalamin-dependent protein [soil metagenome]